MPKREGAPPLTYHCPACSAGFPSRYAKKLHGRKPCVPKA